MNDYKINILEIREAKGGKIAQPKDVAAMLEKESLADREMLIVLHLNSKNEVIEKEIAAIGTLNNASVHPREVFKKAIINSANGIIVVHNHPSGDPTPSKEDNSIMQRIFFCGELLRIEVVDCMILGRGPYCSYQEDGKIDLFRDEWKAKKF